MMKSVNTCRVRFAPSPTGKLHVGNVRTAILNWVLARQMGGSFVLRLEDTDIERLEPGAEDEIVEDLMWLGLSWDEGYDIGGSYGPYRQSERRNTHRRYAQQLLAEEKAFKCYCSAAEVEDERRKALDEGRPPRYAGTCRNLTSSERSAKEAEGIVPAVRFLVQSEIAEFDDLIRGHISFDTANFGDFVILRSNGIASYNFAVVLDDALMEITHVIRGDDHLSNTPRQLLLYVAFGWTPPQFAHTATILAPDRSRLSKRRSSVSIEYFRRTGYLPDAIFNFLSLLSWSPASGEEILSRDRIVSEFSFDRMSRSPAIFDDEKLRWMNGQYLRKAPLDEIVALATPYLLAAGYDHSDEKTKSTVVGAIRDNLATLDEVAEYAALFYEENVARTHEEADKIVRSEDAKRIFTSFLQSIEQVGGWNREVFRKVMKAIQVETNLKGKNLWMPVRAALTGRLQGPELDIVAEVYGKDKCAKRIRASLEEK